MIMAAARMDAVPEFLDQRLGIVMSHWLASRHGLLLPRRSDIRPEAFAFCWPCMWLFRWRPLRQSFQNVIAGEEINRAWDVSSIQGKFIEELFPSYGRALRQRWTDQLQQPAIAYGRQGAESRGLRSKQAERLELPLSDAAGGPYGILGITIYRYERRDHALPIEPPLDVTLISCADLPGD
jgi:hypothetical protein